MAHRSFLESFSYAAEGLLHVLRTQRNMRIHLLIALGVLVVAFFLLTAIEILILSLTIALVLVAEVFNTAVEMMMSSFEVTKSQVRKVKDVAAGAVLLASLNAVGVGYFLFSHHFGSTLKTLIERIKNSSWHLTLIALLLVFGLGILLKLLLKRGSPMRGGMPSIHSALAFSIWTTTIFLSLRLETKEASLITVLVLILAIAVAQSRIGKDIHTIWEVVTGALFGSLVTVMVFQMMHTGG